MRDTREESKFLKKISNYAWQKTIIVIGVLGLAIISLIVSCVTFLLNGKNNLLLIYGTVGAAIYAILMILAFVLVYYYERVRKKLIKAASKDNLKDFFEYFKEVKVTSLVYFEIKDIFMYGLWDIKDRNPFVKRILESEQQYDLKKLKDNAFRREILIASLFHCLTFEKEGYTYRNQVIYLDQNKFKDLLNDYYYIFDYQTCEIDEYIDLCIKIENKYINERISARDNYIGISDEIKLKDKVIRFFKIELPRVWCNFIEIPIHSTDIIILIKSIMIFTGIIGICAQVIMVLSGKQDVKELSDYINFAVAILYEAITIILLGFDVFIKDTKNKIKIPE